MARKYRGLGRFLQTLGTGIRGMVAEAREQERLDEQKINNYLDNAMHRNFAMGMNPEELYNDAVARLGPQLADQFRPRFDEQYAALSDQHFIASRARLQEHLAEATNPTAAAALKDNTMRDLLERGIIEKPGDFQPVSAGFGVGPGFEQQPQPQIDFEAIGGDPYNLEPEPLDLAPGAPAYDISGGPSGAGGYQVVMPDGFVFDPTAEENQDLIAELTPKMERYKQLDSTFEQWQAGFVSPYVEKQRRERLGLLEKYEPSFHEYFMGEVANSNVLPARHAMWDQESFQDAITRAGIWGRLDEGGLYHSVKMEVLQYVRGQISGDALSFNAGSVAFPQLDAGEIIESEVFVFRALLGEIVKAAGGIENMDLFFGSETVPQAWKDEWAAIGGVYDTDPGLPIPWISVNGVRLGTVAEHQEQYGIPEEHMSLDGVPRTAGYVLRENKLGFGEGTYLTVGGVEVLGRPIQAVRELITPELAAKYEDRRTYNARVALRQAYFPDTGVANAGPLPEWEDVGERIEPAQEPPGLIGKVSSDYIEWLASPEAANLLAKVTRKLQRLNEDQMPAALEATSRRTDDIAAMTKAFIGDLEKNEDGTIDWEGSWAKRSEILEKGGLGPEEIKLFDDLLSMVPGYSRTLGIRGLSPATWDSEGMPNPRELIDYAPPFFPGLEYDEEGKITEYSQAARDRSVSGMVSKEKPGEKPVEGVVGSEWSVEYHAAWLPSVVEHFYQLDKTGAEMRRIDDEILRPAGIAFEQILMAVMDIESGGDPNAVGLAGEQGLFQLKGAYLTGPGGRDELARVMRGHPNDPIVNMIAGARALADVIVRAEKAIPDNPTWSDGEPLDEAWAIIEMAIAQYNWGYGNIIGAVGGRTPDELTSHQAASRREAERRRRESMPEGLPAGDQKTWRGPAAIPSDEFGSSRTDRNLYDQWVHLRTVTPVVQRQLQGMLPNDSRRAALEDTGYPGSLWEYLKAFWRSPFLTVQIPAPSPRAFSSRHGAQTPEEIRAAESARKDYAWDQLTPEQRAEVEQEQQEREEGQAVPEGYMRPLEGLPEHSPFWIRDVVTVTGQAPKPDVQLPPALRRRK